MPQPRINSKKEAAIVRDYRPGVTSFRELARKYKTTHSTVQKVLNRNGIKTLSAKENEYMNIKVNTRWDVSLNWLMRHDLTKLVFLNTSLKQNMRRGKEARHFDLTTDQYMAFIDRFCNCPQFDAVYKAWIKSGKEPALAPSLDHIIPISKGGSPNDANNMQYITWCENRAKGSLLPDEWDEIKRNIWKYFIKPA